MAMVLAVIALIVWLGFLFAWYGFWKVDQRLRDSRTVGEPTDWPSVTAIVPARDEADVIADSVASLARQDYPGRFHIVIVDDSSRDDTADIAREILRGAYSRGNGDVISAPPLSPGWAGKLWALRTGTVHPATESADFLWFTDADIVHPPHMLRDLVATSAMRNLALVSLMVRLPVVGFWERFLVPAFIFFFQLLYPFPAVNAPHSRIAGAAGGSILVRREALTAIGGLEAIRERLIDDCALAASVKRSGRRIWLGLAEESRSLRRYTRLADFWAMVARSAFEQLKRSALLLVLVVAGMALIFVVPVSLTFQFVIEPTPAGWVGLAAWVLMSVCYWPTVRYHGLGPLWAATLPGAAILLTAMTVHSAFRTWFGDGERWKGRSYGPAGRE